MVFTKLLLNFSTRTELIIPLSIHFYNCCFTNSFKAMVILTKSFTGQLIFNIPLSNFCSLSQLDNALACHAPGYKTLCGHNVMPSLKDFALSAHLFGVFSLETFALI